MEQCGISGKILPLIQAIIPHRFLNLGSWRSFCRHLTGTLVYHFDYLFIYCHIPHPISVLYQAQIYYLSPMKILTALIAYETFFFAITIHCLFPMTEESDWEDIPKTLPNVSLIASGIERWMLKGKNMEV